MTGTLVDSNVLLDVATCDRRWLSWSQRALADAARSGPLVINAIVFAEVSVGYARIEDLEAVLSPEVILRSAIPYEAAFLAAKAFVAYRGRGGRRDRPPPDFFIGAHAAVADLRLLTRDVRRFQTYFPTLELVCP